MGFSPKVLPAEIGPNGICQYQAFKTGIIYGHTAQWASWIAEGTGFQSEMTSKCNIKISKRAVLVHPHSCLATEGPDAKI